MPDHGWLASLREYRDEDRGFAERFERLELRSGATFGVLTTPLGPASETGWVVCQSFGAEHWHLSDTDAAVARSLAASGFPVLRFHCQGYGDSERLDLVPTVAGHLQDTIDAAAALRALSGITRLGLVGSRFGAAIASLAVRETGADQLVAIDPVVNGRRYVRELLRSRAIIELTTGRPGDPVGEPREDPLEALQAGHAVNIRGFVITADLYDEMSSIDLTTSADPPRTALLLQVSRGSKPGASWIAFADRLRAGGTAVTTVTVSGRYAALFGDAHFVEEGDRLVDGLADVADRITKEVGAWAVRTSAGPEVAEVGRS